MENTSPPNQLLKRADQTRRANLMEGTGKHKIISRIPFPGWKFARLKGTRVMLKKGTVTTSDTNICRNRGPPKIHCGCPSSVWTMEENTKPSPFFRLHRGTSYKKRNKRTHAHASGKGKTINEGPLLLASDQGAGGS